MKTSLMKAISIVFVFMLVLSLTGLVLADTISPDADIVTVGNQTVVELGTVAPGATLTPKVSFVLNCDSKQNHVDIGQTVQLSYALKTVPPEGIINVTPASIGPIISAYAWPVDGNDCPSGNKTLGDNGDSTVTIKAPTLPGTYSYTLKYDITLAPTGNGDNPAISGNVQVTYSLSVADKDTIPPTIDAHTDVYAEATSSSGAVVTYTSPATHDNKDGDGTASCAPVSGSQFALGETVVTCTATDDAGNSAAPTTFKVIVRDTIAPTISAAILSPLTGPNAAGWYNTDVVVRFTCSDAVGVISCPADQTLSEGKDVSSTAYTVNDAAGNTSEPSNVIKVSIDKTAPVITDLHPTTSPNANGWYKTAVVNQFRASDNLSGFAGATNPYDFSISSGTAEGTAVIVNSGTVTDLAGNVSASLDSTAFKIDLTAPTLTWENDNLTGQTIYFGFVPAAPTCTAADLLSGPDGCTVSGYATSVGTHTLDATANDVAGNVKTEIRSYTVLAWLLNGFYQPVDMNGVYNVVKNGSTVPLKFEVFAGPTELTDVASVKSLSTVQVTCNTNAIGDDIETTATGGTTLRYDLTGGQFVYNWQTPKTAGSCYRVTMTTQDGSSLVAYFKLK